jgi:hypothetical protein
MLLGYPKVAKPNASTFNPMAHTLQTLGEVSGLPFDARAICERKERACKLATVRRAFIHKHVADAG